MLLRVHCGTMESAPGVDGRCCGACGVFAGWLRASPRLTFADQTSSRDRIHHVALFDTVFDHNITLYLEVTLPFSRIQTWRNELQRQIVSLIGLALAVSPVCTHPPQILVALIDWSAFRFPTKSQSSIIAWVPKHRGSKLKHIRVGAARSIEYGVSTKVRGVNNGG